MALLDAGRKKATDAQAMPPARRQPRHERPGRATRRWHQCCVSLCVSARPVRRVAVRRSRLEPEVNRHEAHKKVVATRWHDLGRVGTGDA